MRMATPKFDQAKQSKKPKAKEGEAKEEQEAVIVSKFLDLPPAEESEIKNKIYNKVYEDFLGVYQGSQDKAMRLCQLLDIQFNPEDPNESLKAVFKRAKRKLRTVIDFDGPTPLNKVISVESLELKSPYHEVSKSVKDRLLFLFELKDAM